LSADSRCHTGSNKGTLERATGYGTHRQSNCV
jgi:hypothetical protein